MKCLVVVALIIASSEAFLTSGTLNLSGSFQAHPLLANHPILSKHKLFGGGQSTSAAPIVVETPVTESPIPVPVQPSVVSSDSGSTHSFHSKIDIHKILNDIVGLKVVLLKQIQEGVNEKFESKLRRLEKFETHVKNHFNKNSAAGSPSTVALDATISKQDSGLAFDAKVDVNNDSKFAPEINIITNESASTGTSESHDFDLADSSLNAYKSANLNGPEPTVSNCEH